MNKYGNLTTFSCQILAWNKRLDHHAGKKCHDKKNVDTNDL